MKFPPTNLTRYFEQSTQPSKQYDYTKELNWFLPITASSIMIIVTSWIMVSFIYYGLKFKNRSEPQANASALTSRMLFNCVPASAGFGIIRHIFGLTLVNVGYEEGKGDLCFVITAITYACNILIIFIIQFFLWSRQRAFFVNQILNVTYSKTVKTFSYICIIFFIAFFFFLGCSTAFSVFFTSGSQGCVLHFKDDFNVIISTICAIIGAVVYQVLLLGLLAYALTHVRTYQHLKLQEHKKLAISKNVSIVSGDCCTNSTARKDEAANKVKLVLQRTILISVLSMLSDIVNFTLMYYFVGINENLRLFNLFFDLHAFANLTLLVYSFTNYRDILKSSLQKSKNSRSSQ